jgi:hypothetical protein
MLYAGDPDEGQRALAPLAEFGEPVGDALGPKPYTAFQSMFDDAVGPGARNYWKSHYLGDLTGNAVDVICDHAAEMTSPESAIGMLSLGGEVARRNHDATASPHRDATWVRNIQSRWRDGSEDDHHIAWTRDLFEAMAPFATGGVYVNFMSADEGDERVRAAYGEEFYQRLARTKAAWDPENVFHLNKTIDPANGSPTQAE